MYMLKYGILTILASSSVDYFNGVRVFVVQERLSRIFSGFATHGKAELLGYETVSTGSFRRLSKL